MRAKRISVAVELGEDELSAVRLIYAQLERFVDLLVKLFGLVRDEGR